MWTGPVSCTSSSTGTGARSSGRAWWEDLPMTALVLHVNREVIHHGAETALLRDLYLRR